MWHQISNALKEIRTFYLMSRLLTAALLLLLVCWLCLRAQGSYPTGYYADGYRYNEGYWWQGNSAYTRILYTPPGYYYQGHYFPGRGYYVYSFSHYYTPPAAAPTAVAPTPEPGWRAKLLDVARQRDKFEGDLRRSYLEQQQYMEALKALGLDGNFRWGNYGALPNFQGGQYALPQQLHGTYGQFSLGTYGAQGNTVYGYSYNNIAQLYGDTNLSQLYQQASRHTENAQKLAGQAATEFGTLVSQEGGHRARVAEILAKGQLAQEILRGLEGSSSKSETRVYQFRTEPGASSQPQLQRQPLPLPPQMPPAENGSDRKEVPVGYKLLKEHLQRDCAGCHTKPKRDDAFLVHEWDNYDVAAKRAAYERVTSKDEDRRMPRRAEGGPGPRVPDEISKLYLIY